MFLVLDTIMVLSIGSLETYRMVGKIVGGRRAIIVSVFSETHRRSGVGTYIKKLYEFEKIDVAIRDELASK